MGSCARVSLSNGESAIKQCECRGYRKQIDEFWSKVHVTDEGESIIRYRNKWTVANCWRRGNQNQLEIIEIFSRSNRSNWSSTVDLPTAHGQLYPTRWKWRPDSFLFFLFSLSLFRFVLTQHLIERLPNFNKQKIRKKKKRSSSGSTRRRCRESERESKYTPCGKQEEKERKHAATAAAAAHGILFYFVFFLSFSPVLQDARKLRDDTLTLDAACSTRFRETTKEQQSTIPIF